MNILIVEDNKKIADVLGRYLSENGHECFCIYDGVEALKFLNTHKVEFILLDILLPSMDGYEICQRVREKSTIPIIMITAKSEDAEKILGLEIGADDYIIKPFSPMEVLSRINAILRRIHFEKENLQEILWIGQIRLNLASRKAYYQEEELTFTKKEFELIALFAKYPDKVFSRDNILDTIWGYDYYGDSRTVDSHIKRLRSKLKKTGVKNCSIETVWGKGYRLEKSQ